MTWKIRRAGVDFDVSTGSEKRSARLLADGEEVDYTTANFWESSILEHEDVRIEVRWGPRNTIVAAHLLHADGDTTTKTPLTPPSGSKAAKRETLARDHPRLLVIRRVALTGGRC